jgi:hypothetical protein
MDLEDMIWWEREIYVKILADYQEQKQNESMASQYNMKGALGL